MNDVFLSSDENPEILVMTPAAAESILAELSDTMEGLIGAIEEETRLVRAGALIKASEIEPEKSRLAAAYVRIRGRVKTNSVALARHAPAAVEALRRRHGEFADLLKTNLAVLATAREVAEDILRNVSESVGRQAGPRTYGPGSTVRPAAQVGARGIALDRSL
ncbi:flagellar protein FlgN [Prosthecodimorpha staleyi]|uniref:Flagellar protein FlgN n=1 Tax=Prosthecodimorpha staleyi TaxID=2840188 RepID=A0A947D5B2_9HYPH|nr:flagellar protein FlgN [Prosthecodimorpha staleyi]MBT9290603.1 flagellar protein FlgN [Prosthecodimorpha staleyi]